jgi:putative heme-binding domain-containing protein
MDNPVDVAFLPNGERFFTTTFFQHPAAGFRDGLIHAVYGGIYGKDHDVLYEPDHKWTSPNLMPVMTHMGPAAPCGLHCYESTAFGPEYTSNLFACQFNLRKVSRHILKPSGSTYATEDSDFLVSDNTDFHPTDVLEDADGSLLVVDTGGWYKLCCPSSQLVKADVLGAIYRVRKADKPYERQWLASGTFSDLSLQPLKTLYHRTNQPVLRNRALDALAHRLAEAEDEQRIGLGGNSLLPVIWVYCRTDSGRAREQTRAALGNPNDDVAIAACHSVGLWRDKAAVGRLCGLLRERSIPVRRAAAEALGRLGIDDAVPHLVKALADERNDRALDHALTFALMELDNRDYLKNSLDHESPRVRRACLAALDQLGEKLDPQVVLAAMKAPDPALRETAAWIVGRHPEWADEAAAVFREQLAASGKPADREALVAQLARLAKTPGIQRLLAATASDPKAAAEARTAALRAMARAGIREVPAVWTTALSDVLTHADDDVLAEAIATLRAFPTGKGKGPDHTADLRKVIESKAPPEVRLGAMAAVPVGMKDLSDEQFHLLLDSVQHDRPALQRGLAADVLSRARLSPAQFGALIDQLPNVGPLDLDRVLGAFAQTKDEAIGHRLLAALNTPELRPALRADGVKERIKHFPPVVQKEAEKLYTVLNADYERQRARLDETAKTLPPGDVRRGQAVFNSTKTSCIACHTVGYVGGKQGPDLTRIGGIRTERDLLESILFPSASFVRSYEPLIVTTRNGQTFNGVPKKDAPDEIVLVLAADKEVRIPREDVEEVRPGKVSIMPDGLDKQLTPQELADLIAFLRACK